MWDFLGSIFGEGAGLGGIFARVAVAFGLMRFITGLTNKNNTTTTVVDNRIQVAPATTNKIPVAYGASYFNGTIFDIELTNNNQSLWTAIALCETTGNLYSTGSASSIHIDAIYLDNKLITFKSDGTTVDYTTDDTGVQDTNPSGLIGIYLYQGNSSSPMLPVTPGTTTAISGTVPPAAYSIMPGWNDTYMAENLIFAIVKLNYDQNKGQHTIPNLKFHVVNTMSLPGDCLYDYMVNDLYGAGIDSSLINTTSIAALNTYSSQSVTYGAYTAQQRYAINGLIDTSNKVLDNMDKIAATAGSYITYDVSTGKWSVLIQQVVSQTFSFGDHNIIGQISATGTALDSYYNSVEVQFPYAYYRDQNNYIRIDLPSQDLDYNEPINVLKLQHDLINNQVQAAIIGNIMLRQSREDLAVEFKTDFSSYNLQVGDVFGLTNSTYGFTNRQFRVIKLIKSEDDKGELTIAVTGLSYNPDVYTVDTIDQFTPLLGTSSNPNLAAIQTPDAPTVVGSTVSSQPSMTVTATIPTGVVTDMEFWASSDGTSYTFQGSTRSLNSGPFATGSTTSFKSIELLTATWYWKVRAGNVQGTSQFSAASTGFAFTYTQAPDVLPATTPITDSSGSGLTGLEGLGLGLIGAYVASKIDWAGLGSSALDALASTGLVNQNTIDGIKASIGKDASSLALSGLTDCDTTSVAPQTNDVLTWNGAKWVPMADNDGGSGGGSGGGSSTCYLTVQSQYPTPLSTNTDSPVLNSPSDRILNDGNYWIAYASPSGAALSPGSGKAYLYKSNGILVKSISATVTNNQVNLAFGTIPKLVDYYIIVDANLVTDGTCINPAITSPTAWDFHTADPQDPVPPVPPPVTPPVVTCPPINYVKTETYLYSYYAINPPILPNGTYTGQDKISPDNKKVDIESNIGIQFNQSIMFGSSGTITIKSSSGLTFQTFDISQTFANNKIGSLFWISGDTLWLNPTYDFSKGTTYYINMTANCIKNTCNTSGNAAITDSTTSTWTVDNGTQFSV